MQVLAQVKTTAAFAAILALGCTDSTKPVQEKRGNLAFRLPNGEEYVVYANGKVRHNGLPGYFTPRGSQSVMQAGSLDHLALATVADYEAKFAYVAKLVTARLKKLRTNPALADYGMQGQPLPAYRLKRPEVASPIFG